MVTGIPAKVQTKSAFWVTTPTSSKLPAPYAWLTNVSIPNINPNPTLCFAAVFRIRFAEAAHASDPRCPYM
jgi:hypothetical protein